MKSSTDLTYQLTESNPTTPTPQCYLTSLHTSPHITSSTSTPTRWCLSWTNMGVPLLTYRHKKYLWSKFMKTKQNIHIQVHPDLRRSRKRRAAKPQRHWHQLQSCLNKRRAGAMRKRDLLTLTCGRDTAIVFSVSRRRSPTPKEFWLITVQETFWLPSARLSKFGGMKKQVTKYLNPKCTQLHQVLPTK